MKNIFDPKYPITKMHGTGNDFVLYVDFDERTTPEDVRKICDRHFGVGADAVITVGKSRTSEGKYRMKYFNSDGSFAEMCGNGIRCFAKYLVDNKLAKKGKISVDTDAGIIIPQVLENSEKEAMVKVNMGKPSMYNPDFVTIIPDKKNIVNVPFSSVELKDKDFKNLKGIYVNTGVPHVVFFVQKGQAEKFAKNYGSQIGQMKSIFPQNTNVDFVEVKNKNNLTMHVWERGAGPTLACGTGACATLVAAVLSGYSDKSAKIHLPGGMLELSWAGKDEPIFMTGPAVNVFNITNLNL